MFTCLTIEEDSFPGLNALQYLVMKDKAHSSPQGCFSQAVRVCAEHKWLSRVYQNRIRKDLQKCALNVGVGVGSTSFKL